MWEVVHSINKWFGHRNESAIHLIDVLFIT